MERSDDLHHLIPTVKCLKCHSDICTRTQPYKQLKALGDKEGESAAYVCQGCLDSSQELPQPSSASQKGPASESVVDVDPTQDPKTSPKHTHGLGSNPLIIDLDIPHQHDIKVESSDNENEGAQNDNEDSNQTRNIPRMQNRQNVEDPLFMKFTEESPAGTVAKGQPSKPKRYRDITAANLQLFYLVLSQFLRHSSFFLVCKLKSIIHM